MVVLKYVLTLEMKLFPFSENKQIRIILFNN